MASACPEIVAGAGTALWVDQVQRAVRAGAQFIVSPGFNPQVVEWCLEHALIVPQPRGGAR